MTTPLALVLYNQPTLAKDHPDAESEHTVVDVVDSISTILRGAAYRVERLALGADPVRLWTVLERLRPNVVVNLFEGNPHDTETESYVAGLLQWHGVPFTGSPMMALSLARAKHVAKTLLRGAGLPTANHVVVNKLPVPRCGLKWPMIVKPAQQDASIGMTQESVCTNHAQLERRVAYILETYGAPVLIEEFIDGREFNVALIELPELQWMPPAEIQFVDRPGAWPILTYDGKWHDNSDDYRATPAKLPADISPRLARKLGDLAMRAYRVVGCRGYARVDFRVSPTGKPFILEVNPNPEVSDEAGFAGCLKAGGIAYADFILRMVEHAMTGQPAEPMPPTPRVVAPPRRARTTRGGRLPKTRAAAPTLALNA